ncbi:methylase [Scytonema hofmannii PCC 7110]|uniref:Methylase n=1 Tax=Scytonema hofmannii PCC 7110 TaxID=128403 RepID=A0A139X3Z9_9CYAN|nr:type II secretion system protein [Scytonema hofmannii]KYC39427.1 methylase [Scytonema hofmannii PCC 7110]
MQAKRFKSSSNSGFTMLEIVVIVLITGLLAAIAVPSWLAFVDIQRLKTAQGEVYQAMRQAQSLATKNKLTWQASFREHNGIVQWTVHQAQADKFVPYTISVNDNLWHNLDTNIRIDTVKNNKGKSETTLPKDTSAQAWRVIFNYQGCPIYQVGDECTQTSLRTLGQITFSSKNGGKAKRCVYISTILGAMRTGKEHDKANDNGKYCY